MLLANWVRSVCITTLPPVLVLHLQRFQKVSEAWDSSYVKLKSVVEIPEHLAKLAMAAMSVNPNDRPKSAASCLERAEG